MQAFVLPGATPSDATIELAMLTASDMRSGEWPPREPRCRQQHRTVPRFLDGDDVWVPTKLDQEVNVLNSIPDVAMVNGALLYWCIWEPTATEQDDDVLTGGVATGVLSRPRSR
jgi:hypothetical protein